MAYISGLNAVYSSDTKINLTWTYSGPPLHQSIYVQRSTLQPDGTWGDYVMAVILTAPATAWSDTAVKANNGYKYRVFGNDNIYDVSSPVFTTPAAPTLTSVVRTNNSGAIQINWTNNAYIDSGVTFTLQRNTGSGWANVATGLSESTLQYSDSTAAAVSYQVLAVRTIPNAFSSASASISVSTYAAALAPTNLAPNGSVVDFTKVLNFIWQHNPGTDNASLGSFTLQYSTNGGSTWTNAVTNSTSFTGGFFPGSTVTYAMPANTLSNVGPTNTLWRVSETSSSTASAGANSSNASVTGYTTPTVTLTAPPATQTTAPLTASWTYAQAQSLPQAAWQAVLLDSNNNVLETQTQATPGNTATQTTVNFAYAIQNGQSYTVQAWAQDSQGQQSATATKSTTISFLPPAACTTVVTPYPCSGTILLNITAAAPVGGTTAAVDHISIQRRINGGSYVTIANNLTMPASGGVNFVDTVPITNGLNEYNIVAYAATHTSSNNGPVEAPMTDGQNVGDGQWAFLSYGQGFTTVLRYHGDPTININTALNKVAQPVLGQEWPIILQGTNVNRTLSMSGSIYSSNLCDPAPPPTDCTYDSPTTAFDTAGEVAGLVCFRDCKGRRYFGMLGPVKTGDGLVTQERQSSYLPSRRAIAYVEFTVQESYFNEDIGLAG